LHHFYPNSLLRQYKIYHPFLLILLLVLYQNSFAQNKYTDSLLKWIDNHPTIDSMHILTLHRLSYRFSENDIHKAFMYHERVATLSDSLDFLYGKSLAQINLGLLL